MGLISRSNRSVLRPTRASRLARGLSGLLLASALGAAACGGDDNNPPTIDPIPDQIAGVGTQLTIALRASDPDGDKITFDYKTDIGDISDRADLTSGAGGTAVFKWVPIGADVGIHAIDFIASDGKDKGRRQVMVDVKSAAGGAGSPVFIKPLGTGATLDLSAKSCIELAVEVQDADTPDVELGQEPPLIEGATLEKTSGLGGTWSWCPTPEQIASGELFPLLLGAYDGENPKVLKDFLVVLQKQSKPNCPGPEPVVSHQSQDQMTALDIQIDADVSDDLGLKYEPLLLYSTTDPGSNPDISQMTQLTMTSISGDLKNGKWSASIPNPVAGQAPGASAKLYYLIIAADNDDAEGDCDHTVRSPATGTYSINVTNSGGAGGLKECASCSSDAQCGGDNDNCIYVSGSKVCGLSCFDDFDCPLSHECSTAPMLSVNGKSAKQCVPTAGTCTPAAPPCKDDQYEENDSLNDVKTKPGLPPGTISAKSCAFTTWDDDWYPIDIATESSITASIAGGTSTNLNLTLRDSTGVILKTSEGTTSQESITHCVKPGRYYLEVWAWTKAENSYTLTWSKQSGCGGACVDDSKEDDDNLSQAQSAYPTASTAWKSTGLQICGGDDDWYVVYMFKDETLHAQLKFTQTKSSEDLDLYLYDKTGKQLTPCTEVDPWLCDPTNGASGTSNEYLKWNITADDDYYVVVHGWEKSSNKYDICIDYTSSTKTNNGCPPL